MGKGGVGKTTLAAAIAVELARSGHAVHLTTTDPAAHVTATWTARSTVSLSAESIPRSKPAPTPPRCSPPPGATSTARPCAARGRSALALHRGDRRLSRVRAHRRRGGGRIRRPRHRTDRPHPAAARRRRGLPPRGRSNHRRHTRRGPTAPTAPARSRLHARPPRHAPRGDPGARGQTPRRRPPPRRHRALRLGRQPELRRERRYRPRPRRTCHTRAPLHSRGRRTDDKTRTRPLASRAASWHQAARHARQLSVTTSAQPPTSSARCGPRERQARCRDVIGAIPGPPAGEGALRAPAQNPTSLVHGNTRQVNCAVLEIPLEYAVGFNTPSSTLQHRACRSDTYASVDRVSRFGRATV